MLPVLSNISDSSDEVDRAQFLGCGENRDSRKSDTKIEQDSVFIQCPRCSTKVHSWDNQPLDSKLCASSCNQTTFDYPSAEKQGVTR